MEKACIVVQPRAVVNTRQVKQELIEIDWSTADWEAHKIYYLKYTIHGHGHTKEKTLSMSQKR